MIVQLSHHQNYRCFPLISYKNYILLCCSIVYMAQTLFDPQNKYSSILLRNFDILVLFRNPRDVLTVNILGQRAFGIKNAKFLMDCFKLACHEPYTNIIIDYRQHVPDWLMIRQGCLQVGYIKTCDLIRPLFTGRRCIRIHCRRRRSREEEIID